MTFVAQLGIVPITLADPGSPLSVTKTANPNPVASGAQLTYTIVVQNTGGSKVDNIVLTDQVNGVGVIQAPPALPQLTITSTKGSCTQGGPNGNLVTCNAGTMAGGESWTVTIRGQVTAPNNTTLNNTASVTGTKSAQTFTTTGSTSVLVSGGTGGGPLPDLTINKTGPTSVAPSTAFAYTLTINNIGNANTSNVRVVDTLPAGVTFDSTSTTSLFSCQHAAGTVTCDGGAVNTGQNATITINVFSPLATGQITNTAVVDPNNTIEESNELNNTSASVNTTVGGPPPAPLLSILKTDGTPDINVSWDTGAGPDPVNPGEELVYKIQVKNNATSRADDVRVTDTTQGLEASSLIVSMTVVNGTIGTGRGCQVVAPHAICELRSLNAGGTLTMTVRGIVIAAAGSTLFNTATVHGNIKNVGVTNTATEATTVRPSIDLTITKDDSPDPACARTWPTTIPNQHLLNPPFGLAPAGGSIPPAPGDLLAPAVCLGGLTYSFVIGNSGNGNATNVTVRDQLQPGLIFDSYQSTAGFQCSVDAGNAVTCTGGAIDAADTETLTFRLVAPPTVGSITNTVVVDPNNAIFEPDETNNTDVETTAISTGVDLVIWKGDDTFDTVDTDQTDEDPPGDADPLTEGFDPIATNATQTYTIIVDNVGPQDVTGIKVRDVLPAGTRFLSFSATNGFTCTHDGSTLGGNVTCIGGHLLGTASEFYQKPGTPPPFAPGDDRATIVIKVFATTFVQPIMHNEVRVDPDGEIAEINELNNFAFQNTLVTVGNDDHGAFNQLTVDKTQIDPAPVAPVPPLDGFIIDPSFDVAQNGILIYDLKVSNLGTDPVSAIVVKDFLPAGSRFIEARDTDVGPSLSDAFFCFHDGLPVGGTVTCVGGDLSGSLNKIPDGAGFVPTERHIRIKVFAPNTPGTYVNIAVVDPDNLVPEGNEFDNDDAVFTKVTVGGNNMFNELTIEKTQTSPVGPPPNTVATSSIVTWNIVVTNAGSDPAFNVQVTDTLPAGWTFISANDTSGPSDPFRFICVPGAGNTVNCTGATLSGTVNAAGTNPTSRTIVLRAFSSAIPGHYVNTVIVDPLNAIPEGNETNNTDNEATNVANGGPGPFIDLQIDKTQTLPANDGNVTPGGPLAYEIKVTNVGEATAFNVTVEDVLPTPSTYFTAFDMNPGPGNFTCAQAAGVVTCTGGTIPSGGNRTIGVFLIAPTGIEEFEGGPLNDIAITITDQAFVDPDNAILEGDETNNADSEDTVVRSAINLKLEKNGSDSATQNDTTTYTIKVTNEKMTTDGATAFDVKIIDPLPVGLIPLSVTAEPGNFTCQVEENPVNFITCEGDLEAGKDVTITIKAFVTQDGGTLDNEACVDPDHEIDETNELDNCKHAIGQVLPPTPDMLINKTADKGSVTPGEELVYTLTVSNIGTGDSTASISVSDTIPSELTVDDINPDAGWDCSASSGNSVSCERPDLAKGESSHIVVRTTVTGTLTSPFTNTASVIGGGESNAANNSDSVTTSVGGAGIDLQVTTITDTPDPVNTRPSQLTYTIVAVNNGTAGATGAVVRVDLPDTGITVTGVSGNNGFNCSANLVVDPTGKTFDCTGDFGASGDPTSSVEITAIVTVNAGAPNDLVVTVTADPGNAFGESDETNNTLSETTTVSGTVCTSSPCVDLVVSDVLDEPDPADASDGDTITYTVSVVNVGDTPVPSSTVWAMHFLKTGSGTMTVTPPSGITCAPILLDPDHVHCNSTSGVDAMDLAAGAGMIFTVQVSGASAGTVSLETIADIFDTISEFTNSNNEVDETTTVVP